MGKIILASGLLCGLVLASPAYASNSIDTAPGATSLPIAVEGNTILTLTDNPNTATVSGNLTTPGGYVQPGGYADNAQPACGPTNQGALIYSTTQNTDLVCKGSTGTWVNALSVGGKYYFSSYGSEYWVLDPSGQLYYSTLGSPWAPAGMPLSGTPPYTFASTWNTPCAVDSLGQLYCFSGAGWATYGAPVP
jgi:hypothetical protein